MVEEEDDPRDEEVRSGDLHRRRGGPRGGAAQEMSEGIGEEEGEEQGSGGDATSMEEEPGGTGLADPDEGEEFSRCLRPSYGCGFFSDRVMELFFPEVTTQATTEKTRFSRARLEQ